ncbi:hypothetical protein CAPTEDRAFT_221323 [Capitella teleta]|uniref:Uncharacterized protein n=1 Tax=Capitella teleta TaxID=283909 RepID=R7UFP0_CAPTE|nr:hypothetical protein CAPTEDRAFT_221323 [Capitella teleta]|eukprot:ELU05354.1 hypothetical protein CAPTEDRAFT_221323 [Capitella teleta]
MNRLKNTVDIPRSLTWKPQEDLQEEEEITDSLCGFHVEFIDSKSPTMAVMPVTWVCKGTFCYWSKRCGVEKKETELAEPEESCCLFNIREFTGARTDDLRRARELCQRAELHSNLESEEEESKRHSEAPTYLTDYAQLKDFILDCMVSLNWYLVFDELLFSADEENEEGEPELPALTKFGEKKSITPKRSSLEEYMPLPTQPMTKKK